MMPVFEKTSMIDIPDHEIVFLARCLLPEIEAFFESEEGQQEFAAWKAALEKQ